MRTFLNDLNCNLLVACKTQDATITLSNTLPSFGGGTTASSGAGIGSFCKMLLFVKPRSQMVTEDSLGSTVTVTSLILSASQSLSSMLNSVFAPLLLRFVWHKLFAK